MEIVLKQFIECEKCYKFGVIYKNERQENLNFAYSFKPKSVKVLWIVESPPKSDPPRYFYRPEISKNDSLYREVMKSLGIIPTGPKTTGLKEFQSRGYFLIDAAKCPVDKDNRKIDTQILKNCKELLQNEVINLNPESIVIIKSSIYDHVYRCLEEICFANRVLNKSKIPFPGYRWQKIFREAIKAILSIY